MTSCAGPGIARWSSTAATTGIPAWRCTGCCGRRRARRRDPAALEAQFTAAGLAAEAEYAASRAGRWERPYGWGWALTLVHETAGWDDPDARRWAAGFESWLPAAVNPVRHGPHANSAFGLSRALTYARSRPPSRPPSPRRRFAGSAPTPTIPAAMSHPGTTSSHRHTD